MAWTSRRRRPSATGRRRPRLHGELLVTGLEDRLLLAVTNLTTGLSYDTIQAAVDAADPGNELRADAGTYNETVTVTKTLTIEGAQFGVDAVTRSGDPATESVVTGTAGGSVFVLQADGIIVNGFTIGTPDANGAPQVGVNASDTSGSQVLFNIIHNTANSGVLGGGASNLVVTSNAFTDNVVGIYLFGASGVTITNNSLNGSTGDAIILAGGVDGATIRSNSITNTGGSGLLVGTFVEPFVDVPNSNVSANFNRFFSNTTGVNIQFPEDYAGGPLDATNNWWGSNAGPNAAGNDTTIGDVSSDPWLILILDANLATIGTGGSTPVRAEVVSNGNGEPIAAAFPNGVEIAFSATGGTVAPPTAPTAGGIASTVFTSATAGPASVEATLDNQTSTAALSVNDITFDTTPLPDTTEGIPYSQAIQGATGGAGGFVYELTAGAPPVGLTIDLNTLAISGTPAESGTFPFSITATDTSGATATADYSLLVNQAIVLNDVAPPATTVGVPYQFQVVANGGTGPITFAVTSGALPDGLTLDPATGAVTGTPTTAGTSDLTVTATDAVGATGEQAYSIVINALPVIDQTTLPGATVGAAFNQQLTVTGGTAPFTFAVTAGALPDGLTLDPAAGAITGTPTTAGTSDFTVTATDASGAGADQPFTVVVAEAPVISPTDLPDGTVNVAYSQQLTVTGGAAPFTFAVTEGQLPIGLTLDAATGLISGTPTAPGTFDFTVTATDANGATAVQQYLVGIAANIVLDPTTLPVSQVTTGHPYSQQFTASGGAAPYTFTVTTGALPQGLTLDPATGLLSGTVSDLGVFNFTVTATDSENNNGSQAYTLQVNNPPFFGQTTLRGTTVGAAYDQVLVIMQGTAPFTFAVTSGALPDGLTLDANTGRISGSSTTAGTSQFTIQVTDASGAQASNPFSIVVAAAPVLQPTVLPGGVANVPYSQQLTVTGGTAPFTFAVTAGTLPTGLTLDPATGLITGTPTTLGSFDFTVTVTDALGITGQNAYTVAIEALALEPATLPAVTVERPYSQQLTVVGGTAPFTFAVTSGSLPAGLSLNGTTGQISGTPTALGTSAFTVTATDAVGGTASQSYTVAVNSSLAINQATLPAATAGTPYSQQLTVTGGPTPVTFAVTSGSLPAGLTLSSAGLLSGTPTTPGTSNFTVTATAANGSTATQALTFVVNPAAVATGPTVTNLQRFGFHAQPTSLVLTFSTAMDAARAQNVGNYRLVGANGKAVAITRAVYNATNNTVTLYPRTRLPLARQYTLTVNGTAPSGLAGAGGVLLSGSGSGAPGSNFVRTFGSELLAGPAPRAARSSGVRAKAVVVPAGHRALSPAAVDAVLGKMSIRRRRR